MKLRKQKRAPVVPGSSKSMPVNNYYRPARVSKDVNLQNNKTETRNNRFSFSKIINYSLVVGILALVVFATTLSSSPGIQLKKKDVQYYDAFAYQKVAKDLMSDSLLNKSKLLFQSKDFETKMRQEFPEISQIASIVPLGGRDLAVLISVSDPFAVVSNGGNKGILNADGVLVSNNLESDDSGLVKVRFMSPQENFTVGSRILTESEVTLISELNRELQTMTLNDGSKLEIEEILFNVASGQLEVKLKNKPYFLKLSTFGDTDLQVGAVKATLKQLDKENALPTKYMDVRVPNRVFVI